MGITAVHRVSAGCERLAFLTSVRCVTSSLTVGYVGSNGKDRGCRNTVSVGVMSSDRGHELVNDLLSDLIYAVVVVAIFRELAGCLEVNDDAVLVSDRLNLRVLDSGKGVSHDGETCNTCCEITLNISVMESHLCSLIAVFVMHVVDDVQCIYIHVCLPLEHVNELIHNVVIIENVAGNRTVLRTNLFLGNFVDTAV